MEYATIWKERGDRKAFKAASGRAVTHRVEYRNTYDLSMQPVPSAIEHASGMIEAQRVAKARGAKLWNF